MKKTHQWMLFFLFLLFLFTISACTKRAEKIVFYQTKESEITKHRSVEERESEVNSNKGATSLDETQGESQNQTDQTKLQSNFQTDKTQLPSIQETTVSETIAVYLCGEVVNPGVYLLDAGSRLYQAVELAGGLTDQARAEAVNLARGLTDSEQIYIPSVSEAFSQPENNQIIGSSDSILANTSGSNADSNNENEGVSDFPVNINQATVSDLMKLPGIGQVKAEAIVTYREANGSFSSIEEIKNVPGIKEAAFEKLKGFITVF